MSNATVQGLAQISQSGPLGMITLRAKSDCAGLDAAIMAATGCARPDQRQINHAGDQAAGWMSPDEYLLIVKDKAAALAALDQALAGQHYLAVDVSDARAVFDISGKAQQVLLRLSPIDFDKMGPQELRRTRAAQVAVAIWQTGADSYRLICFRSVAAYVMGLLTHSARSEIAKN